MASSFNAVNFLSEPDQDVFDSLRKDNLLALSLYLNLNVKKSWRKIDIQKAIVKHLISADIFDESSLSKYCVASEFDVKKLELSAQLEIKRLESVEREKERERERERESRDSVRERGEGGEREWERERKRERGEEREERERERERERDIELEKNLNYRIT